MTDSLDHLADDYFDAYLVANPTEAHLLGHYDLAGSFETGHPRRGGPSGRRTAGFRGPRRAAGRRLLGRRGTDHPVGAGQRRQHPCGPDRGEVARVLRRPDLRRADRTATGARACSGVPDADVADAMVDKFDEHRPLLRRPRRAPPRGRRPRPDARRRSPSPAPSSRSRRRWPPRSPTTRWSRRCRPPAGIDDDAWRERLPAVVEYLGPAGAGGVPRRPPRRGAAGGPARRPRGPHAGSTTATTPTPHPALLHDHRARRPRRSTTSGWQQVASLADGVPRARAGGRRHRRPARRSSRRCAPTRRCTSTTPTQLVEASEVAMAPRLGGDARLVRGAAAGAVRRRADHHRRQGLLLPAGHRRQPRRHVLRQRRRPGGLGHLRAGVDGVPRGHPRPPPAAGDRRRARRRPRVPQAPAQLGVRRGLGALHRAPRRRDGPLRRPGRPDGHASRPTRCGPAGSSSTPACTRSAGAGSRRSTTWSPTRR